MHRAARFLVTVILLATLVLGGKAVPTESVALREPAASAAASSVPSATAMPTPFPTQTPVPTPTPLPTPSPVPTISPTPFALLDVPLIPAGEAWKANGIALPDGSRFMLSLYARTVGVTEEAIDLAARVAYYEAGPRASEAAQRAVLCVIYNRCMAPRFGGGTTDIETEVYRKGQFSVIGHKQFKMDEMPQSLLDYARDIFLWGHLSLPENVLFFHAAALGSDWGGRRVYGNIGGNLFFYGRTE